MRIIMVGPFTAAHQAATARVWESLRAVPGVWQESLMMMKFDCIACCTNYDQF